MSYLIAGYLIDKEPIFLGKHSVILSAIREQDKYPVAIKLLKAEYPTADEIVRFQHEFEITKILDSPNIVRAFTFEKYQNSFGIILEKIPYPPLSDTLSQKGKLSINEFLEIAIPITETLAFIHQSNVIHKDINPTNIMCDLDKKEIKIIDFGLSATLPKERVNIVNLDVLEGTLPYLSPEQTGRMNRGVDYRTDFYSLGVTFYQMLTGQLPFSSQDPIELVHFHIAVVPKAPHLIDKAIPETISNIVMKLLAKSAEERYQNAYGLIADLRHCLELLKKTGRIPTFTLGTKDVFNRFQIPEKLYGRNEEIKTLMNSYEKVIQGNVELMLIAGYSGIGKSSLVHEIHKPIVEKRGYFVTGKFDQFKRNIPYSVLAQAFSELVNQLLTESEAKIKLFKENILEAVGENGQIIIDIVPNLISIIGEQPPVPELDPAENQNRFSYVFQNFIRALAAPDHPLVIFLDDLQWADTPSLKLIETLVTSLDCQYLFIIGAYRDNEVSSAHPLMTMLDELKKRNFVCNTIVVKPLALEHINELLADTLHQDKISVQALGEICYEKTGGNPFFLIQLLQILYKEQLIEFDAQKNQWVWDLNKIKQKGITDNIVELMIDKIQHFPEATQKILQFAACIGNIFTLDILAAISNMDKKSARNALEPALQEGLIISEGESFRAVSFHFAHDRIQQAAHSLLNEDARKLNHINIARLLLKSTQKKNLGKVLFNIVNHYNIGIDPTIPDSIDAAEKKQIAELNLQASKMAKSSAAFEPALKYVEYGLKCLEKDAWQTDYPLIFDMYVEATMTAYQSAKFDLMEQYAATALKHAKNIIDEVKIIKTRILALIVQNNSPAAIDTVVKTLSRLGVSIPSHPKKTDILAAVFKVKLLMFNKKIPDDVLALPEMTDPTKKAAIELMTMIFGASYMARPNLNPILACTIVNLSLRYGNTQLTANAYSWFGLIICGVLGDINGGYEIGNLALKLMDKMHEEETKAKIIMSYCTFIAHWKNPVHELIPRLMDNFQIGLDRGDMEYACYTVLFGVYYSFFSGLSLKETLTTIEKYQIYFKNIRHETSVNFNSLLQQTILNFIEKSDRPGFLLGPVYNEKEMEPIMLQANSRVMLAWTYLYKLILAYYFQDYTEAIQSIKRCESYIDAIVGNFGVPSFYYYKSLIMLANYKSSTPAEQRRIQKIVKANQKKLKKWEKYSPANHTQRYLLVEAEWARVLNQSVKAEDFYDKAIAAAQQNEFLNDLALANELAAKFYLETGKDKIAKIYMKDARNGYLRWGANAKAAALDQKYPLLLEKETSRALDFGTTGGESVFISTATSKLLDFNSLLKSAQAISSTIVLSDLLKKLMRILIENAGAQECFLLMEKENGHFVIEAEGYADQENAKVMQSIEITNDILPLSIINYVINSKETVVLENAGSTKRYLNDPYIINNKPKSVLCMPLLNHSDLSGILYMENNLAEGVFTQDRVGVLQFLSSQIAISIDNARLYNNSIELNERLISLNKVYEKFVPAGFLSLLSKKSITDVELGNQVQKTMTIAFIDIRNFTMMSEKMSPQENFDFINSFLGVMGPVITNHHGFIDKYIGDAIMAIFPHNADDALQCALDSVATLKAYNVLREKEGKNPIYIGIGINTGPLMLGIVGEEHRLNATVISDAVNVAYRVEALTKTYDVTILITEDTFKMLPDPLQYHLEVVDTALIPGKTKKIVLYTPATGLLEE